jgi:hypothetical protein
VRKKRKKAKKGNSKQVAEVLLLSYKYLGCCCLSKLIIIRTLVWSFISGNLGAILSA